MMKQKYNVVWYSVTLLLLLAVVMPMSMTDPGTWEIVVSPKFVEIDLKGGEESITSLTVRWTGDNSIQCFISTDITSDCPGNDSEGIDVTYSELSPFTLEPGVDHVVSMTIKVAVNIMPGIYIVTTNFSCEPEKHIHHVPLKTSWNLISLPFNESFDKTDIVVNYNSNNYTWDESVSNNIIVQYLYSWTDYSYQPVNILEPGYGYWMWSYQDCELLIPSNAVGTGYITELQVEWNIMGLPYSTSLDKEDLIVHYDGDNYSWTEATTGPDPLILGFIYGWDKTDHIYMPSDDFDPGEGYWMYAYYEVTLKKGI